MDTRFWGPDGWKLFHSVAVSYPSKPTAVDRAIYSTFFNTIQYVLPCIYCRRSFEQYIGELPVEPYLEGPRQLSGWLYQIHNKVNAKLRGQGLEVAQEPTEEEVYERYRHYVEEVNASQCANMPGWNLLYCILFVFPDHKTDIEVARLNHLVPFFYMLGYVVPFPVFKNHLFHYLKRFPLNNYLETRQKLKRWGYRLEQIISEEIHTSCMRFDDRCKLIERYRAGCHGSNKDIKPTCRVNNRVSSTRTTTKKKKTLRPVRRSKD